MGARQVPLVQRQAQARTRARRRTSVVYFVRCNRFVKVGRSYDIQTRLIGLQIGSPYPLELICTVPGNKIEEKEWHRRFQGAHVRGEWFDLDKIEASGSSINEWIKKFAPLDNAARLGRAEERQKERLRQSKSRKLVAKKQALRAKGNSAVAEAVNDLKASQPIIRIRSKQQEYAPPMPTTPTTVEKAQAMLAAELVSPNFNAARARYLSGILKLLDRGESLPVLPL